ncbi:hypothetical protein [Flavobacterium sp. Arc2]|uniref:hypothetical protein n=2 Tax=unclassified Flavobacterium TaxID=196869 RepID=UPI00352EB6EE
MRFPVKKSIYTIVLLKKTYMIITHNIPISLFCISLIFCSCKNSSESTQLSPKSTYEVEKNKDSLELSQYLQKVIGTDENGDNVHGNINIEGEIGLGTLINKDAIAIEIVVEWNGKNKLLATDSQGYKYNLKVK